MQRTKINILLEQESGIDAVLIKGWVRTRRDSKSFSFVEVNDGSSLKNIQVIADDGLVNYDDIRKLTTGSAVAVQGVLAPSKGGGQQWEIQATSVEIISAAPETYPLQKKRHTDEFLRTIAHLRPRTNKYGAAFRIRSELAYAVHHYFRQRGFRYIHTPILTGSDCEGAGEMFRVTTLNLADMPIKDKRADYSQDFFGTEANLTVSGQLSAEMFALSLGDVYTFGPTFRAENSNTRRHAAEFWMIEPEMAFCDLAGNMELGEDLIKGPDQFVMDHCPDDLATFCPFVDKNLMATLENIVTSEFERLPYREAVVILEKAGKKFKYPVGFGRDLQTEHERYLTESISKNPSFSTTIPPPSNRFTCGSMTIRKPSPPWMFWCPVSVKSSAAASAKNAWT
jgi:asparaginyl-tRNA synthetase